jgi:hypothetical protein
MEFILIMVVIFIKKSSHFQILARLADEVIKLSVSHAIKSVLLSTHPLGGVVSINPNIIDGIGIPLQSIHYPFDALDDTLGGEAIIDTLGDLKFDQIRMLTHREAKYVCGLEKVKLFLTRPTVIFLL